MIFGCSSPESRDTVHNPAILKGLMGQSALFLWVCGNVVDPFQAEAREDGIGVAGREGEGHHQGATNERFCSQCCCGGEFSEQCKGENKHT